MELPLTSLIPTIVELISFWETNWPHIFWYPHWYLGNPMRYLTGPIVPLLLMFLHKLIPISFTSLYVLFIGLAWFGGSIGTAIFARQLGAGQKTARLTFIFMLLMPLHVFLLAFGTGLAHIAISILPWSLMLWNRSLTRWSLVNVALTVISITIIVLTNISTILAVWVGMTALIFLKTREHWTESFIKEIAALFTVVGLATVWYTPHFWWTLLFNPSFGGKPLTNVITFLAQLLQSFLPLLIGVWVVQKRYSLRNNLMRFAVLFGSSFLFLTCIRLLSDIDFWMDWSSYGLELQFALSLALPLFIMKLQYINRRFVIYLFVLIFTIGDIVVGLKLLQNSGTREYKQEIAQMVAAQNLKGERWFFSGSPVFWINSLLPSPVMQLRGGRDETAIHRTWDMGAYQIREGEDKETLAAWLKAFGVSYVLVHEAESQEYFRDFKRTDRFTSMNLLEEKHGNRLYYNDNPIARVVDAKIKDIVPPKDGADTRNLTLYNETLKSPAKFDYTRPSQIKVTTDFPRQPNEVISVAVTYHPAWQVEGGNGRLEGDILGNMVLIPTNNGDSQWVLEFRESSLSWFYGLVASLAGVIALVLNSSLSKLFRSKIPSLALTQDEQKDY